MEPDLFYGAGRTLVGLVVSTGFLLALFIGFVVIAGFTKFRKPGRGALVVRNLADRMDGPGVRYLSGAATDRGADQLRTPELLEQAGRKEEPDAASRG